MNEYSDILESYIETFFGIITFPFKKTYKKYNNTYEFTFDGETYITTDCFTNRYGSNFCKYNDQTYSNVSYKIISSEEEIVNNSLFPFSWIALGVILLLFIIYALYHNFVYLKK